MNSTAPATAPRPAPGAGPGPAVRNVVLVGPGGAGKTTLMEAILHAGGAIPRAGTVENGTTVGDVDESARRLHRTVGLSAATVDLSDPDLLGGVHPGTGADPVRLTLLDTPGHADFVGEVRAGLRAADAALFVLSAADVAGGAADGGSVIDGATRALWRECAAVGMPRAVVLTHLDQPRGEYATAVENCQLEFGDGVHSAYQPVVGPDGLTALIGLLSQTVVDVGRPRSTARPVDAATRAAIAPARSALIEAVISESEDDELLDRYLGGDGPEIDFDAVVGDLLTAMCHATFHPVVPCVPTTGAGVPQILELVARGFPSPVAHVLPPVYTPDGVALPPLQGRPDEPLVAEVVRTTTDPYVGRISLVRVFAGTLRPDQPVHVSGHLARFTGHPEDESWHAEHDLDERAGAISRPLGATLTPLELARAGDVVVVARLAHAETGDTLSDPARPAVLPPWSLPEPLLPTAISTGSSSDDDRLLPALARVQAEDPTVRVQTDPETGQLVLWTMGELQLDVVLERVRSRSGVDVRPQEMQVALRETVGGPGAGQGRHVKQSGGHGQYAVVQLEVEPLPEGAGFEFVDRVVGGAVPRQFIPSVEKGVVAQLARGVHGHPLVDVRVTLVGGKAHSVDSSDAAFQTAGALGLKEACAAAGVRLLEPVDAVEITVDDAFVGAVLADLGGRRARVLGTAPATGSSEAPGAARTTVQAEVPAAELTRYAVVLRSLAHGTGTFRRHRVRYAPAPDREQR